MKILNNDKGFALITALMTTMICFVFAMGILTVLIQNTRSGLMKKTYQNAVEASYAGAELQMFEVMPRLLNDFFDNNSITISTGALATAFGSSLSMNSTNPCLIAKLTTSSANWPAVCAKSYAELTSIDPVPLSDFVFTLPGVHGSYTVQTKIVDTSIGAPYVPLPPGGPMVGDGTGGSGGGGIVPPAHYVYRIEVAASRTGSMAEKGAVSVLYEY